MRTLQQACRPCSSLQQACRPLQQAYSCRVCRPPRQACRPCSSLQASRACGPCSKPADPCSKPADPTDPDPAANLQTLPHAAPTDPTASLQNLLAASPPSLDGFQSSITWTFSCFHTESISPFKHKGLKAPESAGSLKAPDL